MNETPVVRPTFPWMILLVPVLVSLAYWGTGHDPRESIAMGACSGLVMFGAGIIIFLVSFGLYFLIAVLAALARPKGKR